MVFGILFAVNSGARALDAKEQPKKEAPVNARSTENAGLEVAATGTARISKETEKVGGSLYRYASLPFEVASVLLLVAIIGSVMLARTIKQEASVDDVAPEVLLEELKYEPELAEFVRAEVETVPESNA
jgi:hypothetical protein